jgi:hypothetical protein
MLAANFEIFLFDEKQTASSLLFFLQLMDSCRNNYEKEVGLLVGHSKNSNDNTIQLRLK